MKTKTGSTLLIHHLSDIHIGKDHYEAINRYQNIVSKDEKPRNLDLYLRHLRDHPDNLPDLIIISGDLTSDASPDDMRKAEDYIRDIKKILEKRKPYWRRNKEYPYILMVPGNHDLDWSKGSNEEKIERYAQMAQRLSDEGVLSAKYLSEDLPVYCDFGDDCNLFVYLLNSTSLGGVKDPKIDLIYRYISEPYNSGRPQPKNESGDDFNSALESLKEGTRIDPGYISPKDLRQMEKVLKEFNEKNKSKNRLKVAVMHHNLSSVPTDDIEKFDAIINIGEVKNSLRNCCFDIVFHGHRHHTHSCHDRDLAQKQGQAHGMYILGGDTLGSKQEAPFTEVQLYETERAHGKELPECRFTVRNYHFGTAGYDRTDEPSIEEIIDGQMKAEVGELLKSLGRNVSISDIKDPEHLKHSINMIQPPLQDLQNKLRAWGEESDEWIKHFNDLLDRYSCIYATDYYPRSSLGSPRFNKYLRKQYASRLMKLKSKSDQSDKCLRFSKPVYDAIMKTHWHPDPIMWPKYEIKEKDQNPGDDDLEIARILIRPKATRNETQELENLDFDHRIFAIPLFVLCSKQLKPGQMVDCAIGFDKSGEIITSYEYKERGGKGKVEWVDPKCSDLKDNFKDMLKDDSLKTVKDFISHRFMIKGDKEAEAFAGRYDLTRKASKGILEKLRQNIHPSSNKVGLDIGCGTGNYTIPFINDFHHVIGLDGCKYMLDVARGKSSEVEWIERDALETGLDYKCCDAVWLISTLHYFTGDDQRLLFKEIFRILRGGGVVFADTEFEEQHDSLWQVEFFPSLKDRYWNRCLKEEKYKSWLTEIGFTNVRSEYMTLEPTETDAALRIGQHNPDRYLDPEIRGGIPAFKEMDAREIEQGKQKLRDAIDDGTIWEIIDRYEEKATRKGDVGFIIATRP